MIGMPVAYTLGLAAILGALWIDVPLEAVMIQVSSGVNSFSLLAIPFFVLAGAIMAEGGMAVRLVNLARIFVGAVRGGLALVNVIASTFFSGVSGSSVADTASIGSVLIPQMVKQGYPKVFATNVTICGSVQAVLIPPSHNAVLYSLAAGGTISVASLFLAGVLPGLLFGACVMGLCVILSYRRGYPKGEPVTLRQAGKIAVEALWGLVTVVIILGGILTRRLHADRIGRGRVPVRVRHHDVRLPRLPLARAADAAAPRHQDGGDGDDADRLLRRLRLHDGADAGAGAGDPVLHRHRQQQVRAADDDQHPAASCSAPSWTWRR